jgi:hypothetical protein
MGGSALEQMETLGGAVVGRALLADALFDEACALPQRWRTMVRWPSVMDESLQAQPQDAIKA